MMANYLLDIVILLTAAVITVPLCRAAGFGAVPGFLVAGILVGLALALSRRALRKRRGRRFESTQAVIAGNTALGPGGTREPYSSTRCATCVAPPSRQFMAATWPWRA